MVSKGPDELKEKWRIKRWRIKRIGLHMAATVDTWVWIHKIFVLFFNNFGRLANKVGKFNADVITSPYFYEKLALNLQMTNISEGDGLNNTYPTVTVKLVIERDPSYFITNVIIPSLFLSHLSIFVFLLPNESGEKTSLQVGFPTFLCFSWFNFFSIQWTPWPLHIKIISSFSYWYTWLRTSGSRILVGGGKKFSIEVLLMECSGVAWMKWAYIGRGPGPSLGPWKLLDFTLPNMHFPWF